MIMSHFLRYERSVGSRFITAEAVGLSDLTVHQPCSDSQRMGAIGPAKVYIYRMKYLYQQFQRGAELGGYGLPLSTHLGTELSI